MCPAWAGLHTQQIEPTEGRPRLANPLVVGVRVAFLLSQPAGLTSKGGSRQRRRPALRSEVIGAPCRNRGFAHVLPTLLWASW